MTLNRQSNLLAWLGLVAVLAVLAVTGLSAYDVRNQTRQILVAEETAKSVTHFRFLILETALYREPRSRLQWQQSVDSFRLLLETRRYTEADENALLKKEQANLKVLVNLYERLVNGGDLVLPLPPGDDTTHAAVASTLSSLFLTTQDMIDDAFELVRLNRVGLEASQDRAARLTLLSIVLMACLILAGSVIIKQRVLAPLALLQAAIKRVKQGDLSHRLRLAVGNEIGMLAGSFDSMTAELEASRDALTKENAERRSAQESLQTTVSQLATKSGELEHAQEELQTIIDHTPAIVVYWDSELRNRFANSAYEEWFGFTPKEMHNRHISEIIGEERLAIIWPHLEQVLAGHRQIFEGSITSPSGQVRDVLFSYVPDIEDGRVKGIYGFISDITKLKQAQAAQAAALTQLQGIVEAASDFAIIATDLRGAVTLFSEGAERMLGYSAEEMIHSPERVSLHLSAEIRQVSAELSARAGRRIAGFEVFTYLALEEGSNAREWTWVRKDGATLPVSLTVTALRDEAGTPVGFLGIAQDIREEKAIRQNLAAARDQAELANIAKSQFLANMSHEIRTPMNAILGMLQLLQHTPLSSLQLDYAVKTQSAAQSLLVLLNDILDFSKIEADKLCLENAPFRIDSLMRDLSVVLSANVGERDVEILFAIDPNLPPLLQGDALRLRQILLNVAGNAVKFTQQGEILIALHVVAQDASHVAVRFTVRDTGIGIAADQLPTIFDGFSQAESSTTRRFGGSGLGLAISQRLVHLMGGCLTVESAPGEGSTFSFSVNFEQAQGRAGEGAALGHATTAPPLRVLVIDDNKSAREILLAMVTALGWHGQGAANGQSALALLKTLQDQDLPGSFPFDTVLIDWRMPDMDGWEVASAVRRRAGGAPLTILLTVSAYGRAQLATRSLGSDDPVSGFLVKPVTASMLFEAVSEASVGASYHRRQEQALPGSDRLRGMRLLVVDDNAMNQQVARELLSKQGAEVEVASGGVAAVDRVLRADRPFDVVLMDIQMPDMDGYEATARIRGDARMQALPIIAMTANAMASDRAACLAAGMNDHIGKPINLDTLVETIIHARAGGANETAAAGVPAAALRAVDGVSAATPPCGIEFDQALRRLGGSQDLYFSMVNHFNVDSRVMLDKLQRNLDQGKHAEAANVLHTLKSAAGIVGAHVLYAAVARHEAALRAALPEQVPAHETAAMVAELLRLTDQSHAALAILQQEKQDSTAGSVAATTQNDDQDVPDLHALLARLRSLLEQSNMRAVGIYSDIERDHGVVLGNRLAPLAVSIGRLDFKQALAACVALQRVLS